MPYPLTPPPTNDYGAFTIPRILQRWLDVNPIGPLTRTQGYITLPTFSQAVKWQGYSDIVVAFNYEGPNNFTLVGFNVEPFPLPNYCLCIAWKDEYGHMNRYSLWRGVGEVIYLNIPVYSGQKIAKNFRFEIWSTNVAAVGQSSPINIYTSVLGGVDYRWGTDFQLVGSDTPCTAFGVNTVALGPNLPLPTNYAQSAPNYFYILPTVVGATYGVVFGANETSVFRFLTAPPYTGTEILSSSGNFTTAAGYAYYLNGPLGGSGTYAITATWAEVNCWLLPLIFPSNSSPTVNTI